MNKYAFFNSFSLEKSKLVQSNRIIKDYYNKNCFLLCNGKMIIDLNDEIANVSEQYVNNYINSGKIYDEIIIAKSNIENFSCIEEFVFYSLLEFNFIDFNSLKETNWDINDLKKQIFKNEFSELLGWGLFDLMSENLKENIKISYNNFTEAYTFFKYPSKPIFALSADSYYYLFINNYYD